MYIYIYIWILPLDSPMGPSFGFSHGAFLRIGAGRGFARCRAGGRFPIEALKNVTAGDNLRISHTHSTTCSSGTLSADSSHIIRSCLS